MQYQEKIYRVLSSCKEKNKRNAGFVKVVDSTLNLNSVLRSRIKRIF